MVKIVDYGFMDDEQDINREHEPKYNNAPSDDTEDEYITFHVIQKLLNL